MRGDDTLAESQRANVEQAGLLDPSIAPFLARPGAVAGEDDADKELDP